MNSAKHIQKPKWLRKRLPRGPVYENVRKMLNDDLLHTVCQEARCPNQWECFSNHTAAFLILGDRCTRNCRFCAVKHGAGTKPDLEEPKRVTNAAKWLNLDYVVVTSVTRDDILDGGANLFAMTISEIRKEIPGATVEVLIPDFKGDEMALTTVLDAVPDVLNHNVETVSRLYDLVRPGADYKRSLNLLTRVKDAKPSIPTKSGIMLGLGETPHEVKQTLKEIYHTGCRMLTIGQYLQPSMEHFEVDRFVTPEEFDNWRDTALEIGFTEVFSGPFVRSSYNAREMYRSHSGHKSKGVA
jgi:lipoic acid synthetase